MSKGLPRIPQATVNETTSAGLWWEIFTATKLAKASVEKDVGGQHDQRFRLGRSASITRDGGQDMMRKRRGRGTSENFQQQAGRER